MATHIVIVGSTICFVLQSVPPLAGSAFWSVIDCLVAILFTLEYAARLFVAPDGRGDEEYEGRSLPTSPLRARLRVAAEPMSVVDLLAVLPFWLGLVLPFAPPMFLQLLRALRLVRVLRMLRLAQESAELRSLVGVITHSLPALRMLCFFLLLELVILGGLVFHAERGSGPNTPRDGVWVRGDGQPATFQSIPDAAWWTLVTLTTVGYGDEGAHACCGTHLILPHLSSTRPALHHARCILFRAS